MNNKTDWQKQLLDLLMQAVKYAHESQGSEIEPSDVARDALVLYLDILKSAINTQTDVQKINITMA